MRKYENIHNLKEWTVKVWRYTRRASYRISRCNSNLNYLLYLTYVTVDVTWNILSVHRAWGKKGCQWKNGRGKIWKRLKETRSIFHSCSCFCFTPHELRKLKHWLPFNASVVLPWSQMFFLIFHAQESCDTRAAKRRTRQTRVAKRREIKTFSRSFAARSQPTHVQFRPY